MPLYCLILLSSTAVLKCYPIPETVVHTKVKYIVKRCSIGFWKSLVYLLYPYSLEESLIAEIFVRQKENAVFGIVVS